MDLRKYVTPIPGAQDHGATGGAQPPRRVVSMVAVIVVALLLGAAMGRALPTKPEASAIAQSPAPAPEPTVTFVYSWSPSVDQPIDKSWEYIPTF
ncbi:MAG: hypothetical protein ACRET6_10275 [Burkholderiales bacterium]